MVKQIRVDLTMALHPRHYRRSQRQHEDPRWSREVVLSDRKPVSYFKRKKFQRYHPCLQRMKLRTLHILTTRNFSKSFSPVAFLFLSLSSFAEGSVVWDSRSNLGFGKVGLGPSGTFFLCHQRGCALRNSTALKVFRSVHHFHNTSLLSPSWPHPTPLISSLPYPFPHSLE